MTALGGGRGGVLGGGSFKKLSLSLLLVYIPHPQTP